MTKTKILLAAILTIIITFPIVYWMTSIKIFTEKNFSARINNVERNIPTLGNEKNPEGLAFETTGVAQKTGKNDYDETYTLYTDYGRFTISKDKYESLASKEGNKSLVNKDILFNVYEIILNNRNIKNCIKNISIEGTMISIDDTDKDKQIVVGRNIYKYKDLICFK